jgi:predicted TIM-barrel fold metal-dependent hydrolase
MMARKDDRLPINRRQVLEGGAALAAGTLLATAGLSAPAQQRPPIIDMHMHAKQRNDIGPAGSAAPRPCAASPCTLTPAQFVGDGEVLRGTLAAMDRYNIVLGFLSDIPERVDLWMRSGPARFLPSPWIPFELGSSELPNIEKLRDDYRSGRFKGMGEITTEYSTIAPNDPRLRPYFALAEELDIPTLIHALGLGAPLPGFRSSLGHPLLLEDVVIQHPRLRLYFENAGYPFLDEAIALMTQYPHVHADLSTITWYIPKTAFDRYLGGLIEAGLGKQLMFGSDQMWWPEAIGLGIERIESAAYLTAEQKRDIFYNNAARFLRLDATGKLPS